MKLFSLALAALLAVPALGMAAPPNRPNVVILLADDSGWGDYSITGNANLKTPNIDSIGRDGATIDRFYVCSVCAPTRAEFLTGRYHSRCGVRGVSTGQERLNLDEKTIADAFRAAGYATGAFGKWHNGSQWPYHPNARGFQEYYGFTSGHWGEYFDPPLERDGAPVRGRGYIADDLTDHALDFIERHRERPFFCYVPFNTPHSPFCVPDQDWDRFRDAPVAMRGADGDREKLEVTRCVLAMMENLDRNVGRVLQRLEDLKLAENTIVVYFSDNGPNSARWNDGMKGRKGTVDEGGVRSVCFIRWTKGGIRPGSTVREIAGAIDLLPTLSALTGVPRVGDKALDGRDLSPLLIADSQRKWDGGDRLIFSQQNGQTSVRSQRYRLDHAGGLFDMIADPGQTRDIAKERPEAAAQLTRAVADWRGDVFGAAAADLRARRVALPPDDRPYPVGYREFPATPLPARDGMPRGGVRRSSSAPNCSYFVNWTSVDDAMTWDIEVHEAGEYQVSIDYACPVADAGSTIALEFRGAQAVGKVEPGWHPRLIDDQDRVPRQGESYMREFRPLSLGSIRLEQGRGPLTLRALRIPGATVAEVRRVTLTLKTSSAK